METKTRIAFGCDHAGFELKQKLMATISDSFETKDFGCFSDNSVDYPDFVHQDRYKYFLKFDSPVAITSNTDSSEINTEIGVYRYSVAQVQPDVIMLESAFVLKSDKVPVKDVWTVEKLYKEIARRNTDKLRIKKL